MDTLNKSLTCSASRLETINLLRLNYKESNAWVSAANKGHIKINKGYWLNECKKDKRALKLHAEKLRNSFLRGRL